jgi:hypothetical protein
MLVLTVAGHFRSCVGGSLKDRHVRDAAQRLGLQGYRGSGLAEIAAPGALYAADFSNTEEKSQKRSRNPSEEAEPPLAPPQGLLLPALRAVRLRCGEELDDGDQE